MYHDDSRPGSLARDRAHRFWMTFREAYITHLTVLQTSA